MGPKEPRSNVLSLEDEAIVDGRLLRGIGIRDLADLPASWMEEERALGIV